jgi:hypothetical protein
MRAGTRTPLARTGEDLGVALSRALGVRLRRTLTERRSRATATEAPGQGPDATADDPAQRSGPDGSGLKSGKAGGR